MLCKINTEFYFIYFFQVNDFHLEKQGEDGQHVDLEMSLDSTGTLVFNLVGSMHRFLHRFIRYRTQSNSVRFSGCLSFCLYVRLCVL